MSIESRSNQYGTLFGDWRIQRMLGQGSGGRSAVFELYRDSSGWDEFSALKVVSLIEERGEKEAFSLYRKNEYDTAMREHKAEAEREVRLMEQLRGKTNIVDYLDHKFVNWSDDYGFGLDLLIRMELLKDLRGEIRQGRIFQEGEIIRIGKDICRALTICHSKGILHRDIKPENIFFNADGDYKLGDFGISRTMNTSSMASTGIGTPEYAAPEQSSGKYDKRVDIYSLGLVLYELSNKNRLPFAASGYVRPENVQQRQTGNPLPRPAGVSRALSDVIMKACAFRPEERYQSAGEFMMALEQLGEKNGSPACPNSGGYQTMPAGRDPFQTTPAERDPFQTMPADQNWINTVPDYNIDEVDTAKQENRKPFPARGVLLVLILLALAAALGLIFILVFPLETKPLKQDTGGEAQESQQVQTAVQDTPELTPAPVLTPAPTSVPTPVPTPAPSARPTEGISSAGTWIKDVKYDTEGNITYLSEQIGNEIVVWEYVYDINGNFAYRKRNMGDAASTLTDKFIPGTDTTYSKLDQTVENCIGFTIEYEVTRLRSGNCGGTRKVVFCTDTGIWDTENPIGTFDYNAAGEKIKATFSFPEAPINIQAFGTLRLKPDDSWFDVKQNLTDVWIADFEYVYIL